MKITYKNKGKEITCLSIAESKLPEMISIPFVEKVAAKVFGKMGIDAKKIDWNNKGEIENWLKYCIEDYKNGRYSDWQIFDGEIAFYAN